MVLPDSSRKSSSSSSEANIIKSVETVPAIIREKNKCKDIIKHTTRKSSFKREGKKEIECTKRISDAIDDFNKFSESLLEELDADYQQMFEQTKKELESLAALPNSTMPTDNKGKRIRNSDHVPELTRTHSEPQEQQNRSSSSKFITPAGHEFLPITAYSQGRGSLAITAVNPPTTGQFATNTRLSSLTTAVNRPAGYFTSLLRQVTNPAGNLSDPHGNNAQTFGRAGSTEFPLPTGPRLGDASSFLNRNMENTSFGGSHALTYDSVPANRFRDINFFENFEMNEAWLRRHGRRNGDSHGSS